MDDESRETPSHLSYSVHSHIAVINIGTEMNASDFGLKRSKLKVTVE